MPTMKSSLIGLALTLAAGAAHGAPAEPEAAPALSSATIRTLTSWGWQALHRGQPAAALDTFEAALGEAADAPAGAWWGLSRAARAVGDAERAQIAAEAALAAEGAPWVTAPAALKDRLARAQALNLAGHSASAEGRRGAARARYRAALQILKAAADEAEGAEGLRARRALAATSDHLGDLALAQRQHKVAKAHFEAARDLKTDLIADHPDRLILSHGLAKTLHRLGRLYGRLGQPAEAEAAFSEAIERKQALVEAWPERPEIARSLGNTLIHWGHQQARIGALEAAQRTHRSALEIFEALQADAPDHLQRRLDVIRGHEAVGRLAARRGLGKVARRHLGEAQAAAEALAKDYPQRAGIRRRIVSLGEAMRQAR